MARLFEDGFDHYGTDENNMLDGVYAVVNGTLSTAQVATGTHSFLQDGFDANNFINGLRKVLPAGKDKMGVAQRLYFPILPIAQDGCIVANFLTSDATRSHVTCTVGQNGEFRFHRGQSFAFGGGDGTLIASTDPLITANAWHHVEIQIYKHDSAGWIRVAVNGIHRYESTGLDTSYDSSNIVSVAHHNSYYNTTAGADQSDWYQDDLYYYDFVGTPSTDTDFCPTYDGGGVATGYIGELDVRWRFCNGDTAEDDFLPSTGSDVYPLIGKATPNDATYAYSTADEDLTEQDLEDLPVEITYIRGLTVWGRWSKSDGGAAMIKHGMESNGQTEDAAERPITVEPTYWWDQINTDPNTDARWTRTSFNASNVRITRSA